MPVVVGIRDIGRLRMGRFLLYGRQVRAAGVALRTSRFLLSPARRTWPLVGLALALTGCGVPQAGPTGPKGPPGDVGDTGLQGVTGDPGYMSLVDTVPVPRGDADCPFGGLRYESGLDDGSGGGVAGDGVLQPGEVDSTNVVCYAPGSVQDAIDPPTGPAGAFTFVSRGGSGGDNGMQGGTLDASIWIASGGHVAAFANGTVDTHFDMPGTDHLDLGSNPLDVPSGTALNPSVVATGGEASSLSPGDIFRYSDQPNNDELYEWTGTESQVITGIHIEAGGTLVVPVIGGVGPAKLAVANDIDVAGVLTAQTWGNNSFELDVWAQHYYGEPGSSIDLKGLDASPANSFGGEGGALYLRASASPLSELPCLGGGLGGVYNAGSIDIRPGADNNDLTLSAREVDVCGSDEVYNTGLILAAGGHGNDTGGDGGTVTLTGMGGGVYNSGDIDVRGGDGLTTGGRGGVVTLTGQPVVNSGTLTGSGGAELTGSTSECTGGDAKSVTLQSNGGSIFESGTIVLTGGSATAAGGPGHGGQGGTLSVSTMFGHDPNVGGYRAAGSIAFSGDVDLSGGDGAGISGQVGGLGGTADIYVAPAPNNYSGAGPYAVGQSIELYGYRLIDLGGGAGDLGGEGGYMHLGQMAGGADIGSVYNEVPVSVQGGEGVAMAQEVTRGGPGGSVVLDVPATAPPTATAVDLGPLTADGGAGIQGGNAGSVVMSAYSVAAKGAISVRGGAGDPDTGIGGTIPVPLDMVVPGLRLTATGGLVSITAPIDCRGGDAQVGGDGTLVDIEGAQVDIGGAIDASGGNSAASGGSGGNGGLITASSLLDFTAVGAELTSNAGAGTTAGLPGVIMVDGETWQEGGAP